MMYPMSAARNPMSHGASAACAASAPRAHSTEMSRASMTAMTNNALILDAALLASIIICAIICVLLASVLVSVLVSLLLVLVLLDPEYRCTPRSCRGA